MVNEHEPGLLDDLARLLDRLAPREAHYAHDDLGVRTVNLVPGERINGHAHCQALLLRASESLTVAHGALCLGRWQRLFLVELDGPQTREVSVVTMGVSAARRAARGLEWARPGA
jgi:secondary thiamine-phosphate synthase enzyme